MRDSVIRLMRGLTILIVVILMLGILGGALWFLFRDKSSTSEAQSISVSLNSLEQIVIGIYIQLNQDKIEQPATDDVTPVEFQIEPGETPSAIAAKLRNMNLITDESLFKWLVRYLGVDSNLEAGDYTLRRNMTMEEIVAALQHGRTQSKTITIPEGWRLEQVAQLTARESLADEGLFLNLAARGDFGYAFLKDRPDGSSTSLEGFLFPDTYQVSDNISTQGLIELLLGTFDKRVTPEMRQRASELRMTMYEVVTLASIVEREAVVDEERPIIASVYINRLNKGMFLQADPTVQYAKGFDEATGRWWIPMTQEDLQTVNSPYNTYLYPGLPPGPICSPGLASIKAVLYPADTSYLFFVAKGDGSHAFATTYEEHLQNIQKYQR